MWRHFKNLLFHSWAQFISSQGTTTLGFFSPMFVLLVAGLAVFIIIGLLYGRQAMMAHWKRNVLIALCGELVGNVLCYGTLFGVAVVKTVYMDHQALAAANGRLVQRNRSLDEEVRKLNEKVEELEKTPLKGATHLTPFPFFRMFYIKDELVDGYKMVVGQNQNGETRTLGFKARNDGNATANGFSIRWYLNTASIATLPQFPGLDPRSAWSIVEDFPSEESEYPIQLYWASASPVSRGETWSVPGLAARLNLEQPIKTKMRIFYGAAKPREINFTISKSK